LFDISSFVLLDWRKGAGGSLRIEILLTNEKTFIFYIFWLLFFGVGIMVLALVD
jgi:hypothetical protein